MKSMNQDRNPRDNRLELEIQSYVDGELAPGARLAFEKKLESDEALRRRVETLREWVQSFRQAEPAPRVPVGREFYWAGIESRLQEDAGRAGVGMSASGVTPGGLSRWWRWLAPAFACLALGVLVSALMWVPKDVPHPVAVIPGMNGAGESLVAELNWTYHSDSDALTIHWIQ